MADSASYRVCRGFVRHGVYEGFGGRYFYFMFHLKPVGNIAHIQVCGTLSCMLCGAEDLISVCKDKIVLIPISCQKMVNLVGRK